MDWTLEEFKIAIAVTVLAVLALMRWLNLFGAREKADAVFLALIATSMILVFIPFDRILGLKLSFLELEIGRPVDAAVNALDLSREEAESLREHLSSYDEQIFALAGSRVLWIDDHPEKRLSARRLLRRLGVELVLAKSSCSALRELINDMDFDLIVTDLTRSADEQRSEPGPVELLLQIRDGESRLWNNVPFVIYTGFDSKTIENKLGKDRKELWPVTESKSIFQLIHGISRQLIEQDVDHLGLSEEEASESHKAIEALAKLHCID